MENENENVTEETPVAEAPAVETPVAEAPAEKTTVYDPLAPAPKKQKKRHPVLRTIALILVCILLGGAAGIGSAMYMQKRFAAEAAPEAEGERVAAMVESVRETAIAEVAEIESDKVLTASQVFAANVNSTVGITTSVTSTNFWGYTSTYPASGSGFILSENGYILTNYHVIEDSESITVSTYDGNTYDASIVGFDTNSDVAVLKIEAEGLVPVVLGSSNALSVGDPVVAIGNPLGELTFTMTQGIVSALDRNLTLSTGNTMKLIQTDCAINSGNSGGALFNMYGEVVGITNAKFSSSSTGASIDNIGFAIPIDSVKSIVESLIEKGYVSRPYLGVTIMAVDEESQGYGLPAGVAIQEIVEDGPAAQAGLQVYDIITAVNGTPVSENTDLTDVVSASLPGDVLEFDIYRQGEALKVSVTVGEKIQTPESVAAEKEEQQQSQNDGNSSNPFEGFGDYFGGFGDYFGDFGDFGDYFDSFGDYFGGFGDFFSGSEDGYSFND